MNFIKFIKKSILEVVVHSIMLLVPKVLANFPETSNLVAAT